MTRHQPFVNKALMDEAETRRQLSEVALGNVPPDLVIVRGNLFNAYTREFIPHQAIWIKHGKIVYVGPDYDPPKDKNTQFIDADGMVVLPGLIDGHTHVTTCKTLADEFVKHVIPTGTTTVVTETMEFGFLLGQEGIEWFVRGFEDQPIRFYFTIPPLCALTAHQEVAAPSHDALIPLINHPRCLGLGEIYWSNLFVKGIQSERVLGLASLMQGTNKPLEGHAAGASGKKLQAYTCFGISSCHESTTESEALERLRLGYWVMIREGSVRRELLAIRGLFEKKLDFRRVILTTDGVDPVDLIEKGYLDHTLKTALRLGIAPEVVYQMVTLNVAEHFGLDHLLGAIGPGKLADLVLIPSPKEYSPQLIMVEGKTIFKEGKVLVNPRRPIFPETLLRTVKLGNISFPSPPSSGKVRAMDLVTGLVTKERIVDLNDPTDSQDLLLALAVDRFGSEETFQGFLRGYGLRQGAVGSTIAWDTRDLIVVGKDVVSLETVMGRVGELGGGAVFAIGKEVVAELPAPVGGILSKKTMEKVRDESKQLTKALRDRGVLWEDPVLTLETLTGCAIPHFRITHHGYVRVKDRQILGWEV